MLAAQYLSSREQFGVVMTGLRCSCDCMRIVPAAASGQMSWILLWPSESRSCQSPHFPLLTAQMFERCTWQFLAAAVAESNRIVGLIATIKGQGVCRLVPERL